jgi:hypothetical protein
MPPPLGSRFVVLPVRVVSRGCAIPGAWPVLPATEKHAWRGGWLRMVRQLRPAVPPPMTVSVLADRGRYARWWYRRIVRWGGPPFLRGTVGGTFRPADTNRFQPLRSFAPQPGTRGQGRGTACVRRPSRRHGTLLACGEEGHEEAGFILTDLPPERSAACGSGLRAWLEQGCKLLKRGGGPWQRTRMTDPQRAARLWWAVAVATLWRLRVGGEADLTLPPSTLPDLTARAAQGPRPRRATRLRLVRVFRQGWNLILGALLNDRRLPIGHFKPELWPSAESREIKLKVTHELLLAA